jgi:hypothetical protein
MEKMIGGKEVWLVREEVRKRGMNNSEKLIDAQGKKPLGLKPGILT